MEITLAFAIAVGGIFLSLALYKLRHRIRQFLEGFSLWTYKHFVYPQCLRRHRYLGPWSRADVLLQLIYIAVHVVCLRVKVSSISEAGLRAANLSLINLIPLFSGPSFNVLTDLLGISLGMFRRFHRLAGVMSFVLLVFHVITVLASRTSFSLHVPENLWGLIVSFNPFYRILTIFNSAREDRRYVFSYSLCLFSACYHTKSSSARIKHWQCFLPIPFGVTWHRSRSFPAYISTYLQDYSFQRFSSSVDLSSGETKPLAVVILELLSATRRTVLKSAYLCLVR
jgi:hypothetical protein